MQRTGVRLLCIASKEKEKLKKFHKVLTKTWNLYIIRYVAVFATYYF